MSDKEQTPVETLDDLLNTVQTLPLDTQHHTKQILLNDKLHHKLEKKIKKLQKVILKAPTQCTRQHKKLSKYSKRMKTAIKKKLESASTMQSILTEMAEKMKEKMHFLNDEIDFNLPIITNMPTIVRTGQRGIDTETEPVYCVCNEKSHGDMICCDSDDCKTGWFHFSCVGLCSAPKGQWYCESCRRNRRQKKL